MNPDDGPVNNSSIEHSINYIQKNFSKEVIFLLLTDDDYWKDFVAKGHVSRGVAEQVREGLMAQEILKDTSDEDRDEQAQEDMEQLLNEFPKMENEIEQLIAQLRALADKAEGVHRNCTTWNLVASSSGVMSSILTIAGLGAVPMTAGLSLGLTAAGIGLGAASAVTGVTTSIVGNRKIKAIEDDVSKLTSTLFKPKKGFLRAVGYSDPDIISNGGKVFAGMMGIKMNIRAFKLIRANPQLAARATRLMNSGEKSVRSARLMQKAFSGTALAMSKGARIAGMAAAGVLLVNDVYSVVQQLRHLKEGAEGEPARWLREQAAELERKLEKFRAKRKRFT